jgi:DNA-binding transcriptional LysR family regulator
LDLALLGSVPPFRPPDAESPALKLETLAERSLCLAVSDTHPLARADFINVADLRGQRWIASASSGDEQLMGVWPGLDERPEIAHTARDWLAKLHLVAAGCGITTVSPSLTPAIPPGVRVLPVHGGSQERRRILLARLPGPLPEPAAHLADALRATASRTSTAAQPQ